jgi:hypothetical protein
VGKKGPGSIDFWHASRSFILLEILFILSWKKRASESSKKVKHEVTRNISIVGCGSSWTVDLIRRFRGFRIPKNCKEKGAEDVKCDVTKRSKDCPQVIMRGHIDEG